MNIITRGLGSDTLITRGFNSVTVTIPTNETVGGNFKKRKRRLRTYLIDYKFDVFGIKKNNLYQEYEEKR